tara:strand:- start:95 stop:1054 length:960 start_codon:yes stop_codon:yes gene_type:complete
MSVNFPTAFWKNQPAESEASAPVEDTIITWSKKLYYGYNMQEPEFLNPVDFADGGLQITTTFPFNDYSVDGENKPNGINFFPAYEPGTIPSDSANSYFGWFLNETSNTVNYDPTSILSRYHRHDPWIVSADTQEINLFFEADYDTAWELDWVDGNEGKEYYNRFIQSGYAEGTFSLQSNATVQIKASGLGETDQETEQFDKLQLYLNSDLICKGRAPADYFNSRNWDMNSAIFTNSDGDQDPATYYNRLDRSTSIKDADGNDQNNVVNQYERTLYANSDAQFSTSVNLDPGDHTIKIYYNTNDGLWNSGAFYGTKFTFS